MSDNNEIAVRKKKQDGGREVVWPIAEHFFAQRVNAGMERYGEPLMTHNGLDVSQMAMEEIVDALLYVTQMAVELRDAKARIAELEGWLAG